jgi:hypothetical protein
LHENFPDEKSKRQRFGLIGQSARAAFPAKAAFYTGLAHYLQTKGGIW